MMMMMPNNNNNMDTDGDKQTAISPSITSNASLLQHSIVYHLYRNRSKTNYKALTTQMNHLVFVKFKGNN
jgi:hypothetical protein